jgi:D-sedoheptulose 7-phosphate isomerase
MNEQGIRDVAAESIALKKRFFEENARLLMEVGSRMAECLRSGGKVLTFGNGGSAADAQHFAGELVGRFLRDRPALAAMALTTDPSVITAVGNDMGYEAVFRRQVEAHGRPETWRWGLPRRAGLPTWWRPCAWPGPAACSRSA